MATGQGMGMATVSSTAMATATATATSTQQVHDAGRYTEDTPASGAGDEDWWGPKRKVKPLKFPKPRDERD